ncbi:MAG: hypothetical protein ACJ746_14690 [Bryobacteraceae bacterium]
MRGNDVFLEAPSRTQELLNIKWTLKAAGFRIGSTWHDDSGIASTVSKDHWDEKGIEQLQACDSLVVICGSDTAAAASAAMIAGLALARGLQVVWIGPWFGGLNAFSAVRRFNTADDYEREVLRGMYSESASNTEQIAA